MRIRRVERWREVPGWPDYEVSSLGRVRSWKKRTCARPGAILKRLKGPRGYWQVNLHRDGKRATKVVHRLVALAFLGPRPDGMQVLHKNGKTTDPRLGNLRYGTPKENAADAETHGTQVRGSKCGKAVLTESDVVRIRELRQQQVVLKDIAEMFGVSITNVHDICRRRTWTHV